jgi:putative flippase GtrA
MLGRGAPVLQCLLPASYLWINSLSMPMSSSSKSGPSKQESADVAVLYTETGGSISGQAMQSLAREGVGYALVGIVQICVDSLCFVLLTYFGMATVGANIAGRIGGALLGFWLNGRFTFSAGGIRLGRGALLRFALSWGTMTAISTFAVSLIDQGQGLHMAWVVKPLIDVALAAAGFLVSKFWIYR